jgi:parallel beta helix pectate lyase-like protein
MMRQLPWVHRLLICTCAGALLVSCAPVTRTVIVPGPQEAKPEPSQPSVPAKPEPPQPSVPAKPEPPQPSVLRVGPNEELKRPSAAAGIARNGDVVEIEAGIYAGDAAVWRQHRLTIRGVGGRAYLRADGAQAEGKAIWVIKGSDVTVEGVEFSGAKVPDGNGAGIRFEGAGLTVRDCYFHHNQNGILTSPNPASEVVVEHSEFAHNGAGDGLTHNIYIGRIGSFTLRFSYVHHSIVGHNVKSRALKNYVTYNRIMDESDGRSSYTIDLPNGGLSFVIGNLIQQGPATENFTIVSYGAEGLQNPQNELYFVNNTVVNDRPGGGRFLFVRNAASALIVNNLFSGKGELLTGPGELRNNLVAPRSDFADPARFDYRLKARASAIGRGIDPASAHGFALRPTEEYVHKAQNRPRSDSARLDLGALEYRPDPGR